MSLGPPTCGMKPHGQSRPVATVLVADHDTDTRTMYCQALRARGYAVMEESDGRDALVRALTTAPCLVVARQCLPLLDGDTLCQLLRRDRTTATSRIVIVTDDARATAVVRASRTPSDVVLTLPVSPHRMADVVHGLLDAAADSSSTGPEHDVRGEVRVGWRQSKSKAGF